MSNLQMISMVNSFPIGSYATSREELLSKAEIISYLSRFQEQFSMIENGDEIEMSVRNFLCEVLAVNERETFPSLAQAVNTLKLSADFVQNFDKIQYLKENEPKFNQTYDMIASSMGLTVESQSITR